MTVVIYFGFAVSGWCLGRSTLLFCFSVGGLQQHRQSLTTEESIYCTTRSTCICTSTLACLCHIYLQVNFPISWITHIRNTTINPRRWTEAEMIGKCNKSREFFWHFSYYQSFDNMFIRVALLLYEPIESDDIHGVLYVKFPWSICGVHIDYECRQEAFPCIIGIIKAWLKFQKNDIRQLRKMRHLLGQAILHSFNHNMLTQNTDQVCLVFEFCSQG